MTTADWTPAVDIAETADEYLINVELTEVSKADVKISARDGVLAIEGQRPRRAAGRTDLSSPRAWTRNFRPPLHTTGGCGGRADPR